MSNSASSTTLGIDLADASSSTDNEEDTFRTSKLNAGIKMNISKFVVLLHKLKQFPRL